MLPITPLPNGAWQGTLDPMRLPVTAALTAAILVAAAPAAAAGPAIMPLAEVRPGMECTGLSVIRGTDVSRFEVEVLEIVDGDPRSGEPRILVRVSGPAVDATGIGPGFSGSPILCDGRVAGAISESVGQYGGTVVLATPIEAVLAEDATPPRPRRGNGAQAAGAPASAGRAPRGRRLDLVALTASGLSPALARRIRVGGRRIAAAPRGPLRPLPKQTPQLGSAIAVGLSTGDLRLGAIGTVAYVDGDRVWGFAHPFDGAGRRELLLQDAYVYRVIANPVALGEEATTYKLASAGNVIGTLTNDAIDAVVGRLGALPRTIPLQVHATDDDTGRRRTWDITVADESRVDEPGGVSALAQVAPIAVAQAVTTILRGAPARTSGELCLRIHTATRTPQPLRVCNAYVAGAPVDTGDGTLASPVTARMVQDVADVLAAVDGYVRGPVPITRMSIDLHLRRGADQAFMRRARALNRPRPGGILRVRVTGERVRGPVETFDLRLRVPRRARAGAGRVTLTGLPADEAEDGTLIIFGDEDAAAPGGDSGPRTTKALTRAVRAVERRDALGARLRGTGALRELGSGRTTRLSGQVSLPVRIIRTSVAKSRARR